ncbi:MAG: YceD family protein [Gammaproteobacteria bacterium]
MLDRLPKYIDPIHLADKRSVLKGRIPLSDFSRLAGMLMDDSGSVAVDLFFAREGRLAILEGRIESTLNLICQNCLQALSWPVDNAIDLGIVSSIEEAKRLPENHEPLVLEGVTILLADIIEDELLLIIPQYPKHQHDCLNQASSPPRSGFEDRKPSRRDNPFSILTNLKTPETHHGSTKK